MSKPSVLGRGLSSLLTAKAGSTLPATNTLALDSIQPGHSQPRGAIDEESLIELAATIKAHGVLQPILVRRVPVGVGGSAPYEIIAGERRWRAARLAGLAEIPVHVSEMTDQETVAVALIENIQREQLTPAEEARALQRLIDEFKLTHQAVADAVGRSRAAVTNLIRLLDLPTAVVKLIDGSKLSMGHARALLGLEDGAAREKCAELVIAGGWSVRETEKWIRRASLAKGSSKDKPPELFVVTNVLQSERLNMQLHSRQGGAGRLVIDFGDQATGEAIIAAVRLVATS